MTDTDSLIACQDQLKMHKGWSLVVGVELEFYIDSCTDEQTVLLLGLLMHRVNEAGIPIGSLQEERGNGQYEVDFCATSDLVALVDDIDAFKALVENIGHEQSVDIHFHAKPKVDQPGSAMHINISINDADGQNLFARQGEEDSPILAHAVAGLLDTLEASMAVFAPFESCYERYQLNDSQSPSTMSWGGNNRSVAIRIPETTLREHKRRIEHRVPCADADPRAVIEAIVAAVVDAVICETPLTAPKIWGMASDEQYDLPKLPGFRSIN